MYLFIIVKKKCFEYKNVMSKWTEIQKGEEKKDIVTFCMKSKTESEESDRTRLKVGRTEESLEHKEETTERRSST